MSVPDRAAPPADHAPPARGRLSLIRIAMLLGVIALWFAAGLWLKPLVGWPQDYGFTCSRKGCLFADLWHSPMLLRDPGGYEVGMFLWIWSLPVLLPAILYLGRRR